jgi:hypothetical protein
MVDSSGVNWGLGIPQTNPGAAFADAYRQGLQQHRQDAARQAMAALVQNPNDPKALAALAEVDPQTAMQFRQQRIAEAKAHVGEHYDNVVKGAKIIRETNPQDQASWTRALALAQQAGVDTSQIPQVWNEETKQYAAGVMHLADAFAPQASDNLKIITPQPGGGAYGYDPRTQHATTIIQPNDNPALTGQPVGQGMPHVTDQSSYDAVPPGAQYMSPDGHIRTKQGGQTGAPSGGFL